MSKKRFTMLVSGVVLLIAVALIWGYVSAPEPHGKIVAQLQQKDASGCIHTVTVRQFAGRFNTELSEEGSPGRVLPVSSYEFYEGSDPITSAIIRWPELHGFSVTFSNGLIVDCSWSETSVVWTRH
jgi:hypothetical protein